MTTTNSPLEWIDDRWHCDGRGIHAGAGMELRGSDGQWFGVRVESADCGRVLIAYGRLHGLVFTHRVDVENDQLRWPDGTR